MKPKTSINWQPIETAPSGVVLLLGTESDPAADYHMFFVDIGWAYKNGFWSVSDKDIRYPSHWAPLTSPVESAKVAFYDKDNGYVVNWGK